MSSEPWRSRYHFLISSISRGDLPRSASRIASSSVPEPSMALKRSAAAFFESSASFAASSFFSRRFAGSSSAGSASPMRSPVSMRNSHATAEGWSGSRPAIVSCTATVSTPTPSSVPSCATSSATSASSFSASVISPYCASSGRSSPEAAMMARRSAGVRPRIMRATASVSTPSPSNAALSFCPSPSCASIIRALACSAGGRADGRSGVVGAARHARGRLPRPRRDVVDLHAIAGVEPAGDVDLAALRRHRALAEAERHRRELRPALGERRRGRGVERRRLLCLFGPAAGRRRGDQDDRELHSFLRDHYRVARPAGRERRGRRRGAAANARRNATNGAPAR